MAAWTAASVLPLVSIHILYIIYNYILLYIIILYSNFC